MADLDDKDMTHLMKQGHTIFHMDRGTYTHSEFWNEVKGLPEDREVRSTNGNPVHVPLLGRNLQVGDILPERRALVLDSDAAFVPQTDFESRYTTYLRGYRTHANVMYEPVPNVMKFAMKQIDPARPDTEGRANLVDLGFDATKDRKPKETGLWHPDGILMDDWRKQNPEAAAAAVAAMTSGPSEFETKVKQLADLRDRGLLSAAQMAEEIASMTAQPAATDSVVVPVEEPDAPSVPAPATVEAPCGKTVKVKGLVQHKIRCKKPQCSGDDEPEAA